MTESPFVIIDTNVIFDFSHALKGAEVSASQLFGGKNSPQIVLTESVGKEVFGGKSFSLSGGTSIVQDRDATGHITLKPWEEAQKIIEKNLTTTTTLSGERLTSIKQQYDMLSDIASHGKLIGTETRGYGAEPDPAGKRFSGLVRDAGERSIAAAEADLKSAGKEVFIVSNDQGTIKAILNLPGNADHAPQLMNAGKFVEALANAGTLSPEQQTSLLSSLHNLPKTAPPYTDVISKGLLMTPDPERLQLVHDQAPGKLASAIKESTAQPVMEMLNGAGQAQMPVIAGQPGMQTTVNSLAHGAEVADTTDGAAAVAKTTIGTWAKLSGPALLAAGPLYGAVSGGYEKYKEGRNAGGIALGSGEGLMAGTIDTVLPGARTGYADVVGGKNLTPLDRALNGLDYASSQVLSAGAIAMTGEAAGVVTLPAEIPTGIATGAAFLTKVGVNVAKAVVKISGHAGKDQDGGVIYDLGAGTAHLARAGVEGIKHYFSDPKTIALHEISAPPAGSAPVARDVDFPLPAR